MKKRRFLSLLLLLALLISCVSLYACKKSEKQDKNKKKTEKFSEYSLDYFDTATTITGYAETREEFDKISQEILSKLAEYHKLFTIYHRYNGIENLCTVNELKDGAHRTVTVDPRIIDLLLYAKDVYSKTGGKVNVAMGSVLSIWHDYRTEGMNEPADAKLPPNELLTEAAKHTNIDNVIIDKEKSTVFLADPKMSLDVGAIAKGYAVEMIARSLEEKEVTGYVINVGGNVRTVGIKGDGKPWVAGIENPNDDENEPYIAYLNLSGESLVTSGSYQRYYTVEGKNYHHIIDPATNMPAERYLSVSIVCKDSGLADGLSTALFCMSYEEGLAILEAIDGAEAIWVFRDGTRKQSSGFFKYVK